MKISKTHHQTRRGVIKRNPKRNSKKIPIKKIIIHWREGRISAAEKYPMEFNSIKDANKFILETAYRDGPKGGGYNKHKIELFWADGNHYEGRWDVKYPTEPEADLKIGEHIKDYITYLINNSPDSTEKEIKDMKKFLERYDLED